MEETKSVKLLLSTGEEVTISKFALGRYAKLLGLIDDLPSEIQELDTMDTASIIKLVPVLISKSSPMMFKILALASDTKPEDWDTKYDLVDAVNVVASFLEVNDFEQVKKAMSRVSILFKKNPQEMEKIASTTKIGSEG